MPNCKICGSKHFLTMSKELRTADIAEYKVCNYCLVAIDETV